MHLDLSLRGCTSLAALPDCILRRQRRDNGEKHLIDLEGIGMSSKAQRDLKDWVSQQGHSTCGVHLRFSSLDDNGRRKFFW